MPDKYLSECAEPNPIDPRLDIDPVNPDCPECDRDPSQKDVPLLQSNRHDKMGIGREANCDPMQFGHIVDDFSKDPKTLHAPWMASYIPRYSKAKRGCDEVVKDLFEDVVVIDEQ